MTNPIGLIQQRQRVLQETPLREILDVEVLQRLQDWLAVTNHVSVIVRDLEGRPVTKPSYQNEFCKLVQESPYGEVSCRVSNQKAVKLAAAEHRVAKYVCHAGLTQFAAPIEVDGICIGTIVMGDRPEGTVSPDQIAALARRIDVPVESVHKSLEGITRWSEDEMQHTVTFLLSIANAVAALCYQGTQLRTKLNEISSLYEVSKLLTGTLNLQDVLDLVAKSATELSDAKGCSIRLLNRRGRKLVVKSYYNLSERYMDKGPVLAARSPIDKLALSGKVIQIHDMQNDPRVLYPKEAAREGIRSGICVGLIAQNRPIGTMHLYSSEPRAFDEEEEQVIRSLANQAAIAIRNAQLYQESLEKRRLAREIRVAGEIQEQLLPDHPPQIEGFEIAATAEPCSDVGGDFYDFVSAGPDKTAIVIADVSGKGVPSALLMASARAGLRAHMESTKEPHEICRRLNRNLYYDTRAGQFVSLFCGVLDKTAKTLAYTNGGHNPPILFRNSEVTELEKGGLVLGADEDEIYEEETLSLQSGDVVLFYTDGVTEALNSREDIFGVPRLVSEVKRVLEHNGDAERIVTRVLRAVRRFKGKQPQSDDITLVVLRVL